MSPKKKKKSKKKGAPQPGNLFTRLFFRPHFLVLLAILVSAFMLIPRMSRLLPNLQGRDGYRLQSSNIQVTLPPRWVPINFVDQVIEKGGLPEELSLLDKSVVKQVANAFAKHPWVAEVKSVRKVLSGIQVDLEYRQPVAMVHVKQGLYPVDKVGTLLPPGDFSPTDIGHYPKIENIVTTPQGAAGQLWGDVVVEAAAKLAAALEPHWKKFSLASIYAPTRNSADTRVDDLVFEINTEGGSQIVWGRAPGTDHPGELSVAQKIGRLDALCDQYGTFDENHGKYRIEYHWNETSRQPITSSMKQHQRR